MPPYPTSSSPHVNVIIDDGAITTEDTTSASYYDHQQESCYATMKTRTVRKRKDIDKSITQSLRDSLLILNDSTFNNSTSSNPESLQSLESTTSTTTEEGGSRDSLNINTRNNNNTPAVTMNGIEGTGNSNNLSAPTSSSNTAKKAAGGSVVKRVSFSQVDWHDKLKHSSSDVCVNNSYGCDEDDSTTVTDTTNSLSTVRGDSSNNNGVEIRRTTPGRNKNVQLRRRPGRRMDKKKVKVGVGNSA